jgi:acetoin utilization deacetylase AcuC-like enzyme
MKTGVFFHNEFKNKDWPIIGDKFHNFPEAMEKALSLPDVAFFESKPVTEEILLRVHSQQYIEDVKRSWYYRGATLAVGGCVEAGEMIAEGRLKNALVFSVGAGHHSGPSSGWGGTYLSCSGPTIKNIRDRVGHKRFAILDTDCHHGDGTRAVFEGDLDVLHVCFCSYNNVIEEGTKVDVDVWGRTTDEEYLNKVRSEFIQRAENFKPFMILHNLGHDTGQGDYGDIGLTRNFFLNLAKEVKACAERICEGRYLIITHGGARADTAEYIFPRIVEILAES